MDTRTRIRIEMRDDDLVEYTEFAVSLHQSLFTCPIHIGGCPKILGTDFTFCKTTSKRFVAGKCLFAFSGDKICITHPSFFNKLRHYEKLLEDAIEKEERYHKLIYDVNDPNISDAHLKQLGNQMYDLQINYGIYVVLKVIELFVRGVDPEDPANHPELYDRYKRIFYPIMNTVINRVEQIIF